MVYDKPFKTFEEQVLHARDEHGLIVHDVSKASEIFKTYSYYDLINGYISSLSSTIDYNKFDNISLDFLLDLFLCDREIQGVLFTHSVHCETKFKNVLANVISEKYGVHQDDYLDPNNFNQSHSRVASIKLLTRISDNYKTEKQKGKLAPGDKDKDYVNNPTKHYRDNHNHIPPWILFKNTDFNDVIDLYQILFSTEKDKVTKSLISHPRLNKLQLKEFILTSITGIRKFRNAIAHNRKFITFRPNLTVKPFHIEKSKAGDLGVWNRQDNYDPNKVKGILFYICSLINILDNNKAVIAFIIALIQAFRSCEVKNGPNVVKLYYDITSLPADLMQRLEKALNTLS